MTIYELQPMNSEHTFPTRLDELAFLLEEVPRSLRKQFDGRVQPHGLGRTQWRILACAIQACRKPNLPVAWNSNE